MNHKLQFRVLATKWNARAGEFTVNGVTVQTPVFMPVWTKATIKWLILDILRDPKYIGDLPAINLILANTFHLFLHPGESIIQQAGWLHTFENRDQLILTDSGWFQAFSLAHGKSGKSLAKLTEDGVKFRSPSDGSKHFFSPEWTVDVQCALWSDIMMMLDVCSPAGITKKKYYYQMKTTHERARRQYEHFMPKYEQSRGVLFPIVQWWTYEDLREESLAALQPFAYDGIAVGGVSVGESYEDIARVMQFIWPKLPQDKPRYIMGIGTPESIREAILAWFDMFDCVLPTRLGRHGVAMTSQWNLRLKNAQYKNDFTPLDDDNGFVSKNYTKAYLHHLVKENEMLGGVLLSLHNIMYLHRLVQKMREEILK
jgi:queuine tRNA-ribosyltransferase